MSPAILLPFSYRDLGAEWQDGVRALLSWATNITWPLAQGNSIVAAAPDQGSQVCPLSPAREDRGLDRGSLIHCRANTAVAGD
jgi:hypothetical protein